MLKVGITGGIASGKSAVCSIFEMLGIPVYYADIRAKALIIESEEIRSEIIALLGAESYRVDGSYNTGYVSNIVFANKQKLQELNHIVHPKVKTDYQIWHEVQHAPFTLHESALIIEGGFYKMMDKLIVVTAPEALRVKRIIHRDGISEEEAIRRIKNQMPEIDKIKYADYLVNNNEQYSIVEQCMTIFEKIIMLH